MLQRSGVLGLDWCRACLVAAALSQLLHSQAQAGATHSAVDPPGGDHDRAMIVLVTCIGTHWKREP